MTETLANFQSVFPQFAQGAGAAPTPGSGLPASSSVLPGTTESTSVSTFQARLNEILGAAGERPIDPDGVQQASVPAPVLTPDLSAVARQSAAGGEPVFGQSGNLLPLDGKLLPSANASVRLPIENLSAPLNAPASPAGPSLAAPELTAAPLPAAAELGRSVAKPASAASNTAAGDAVASNADAELLDAAALSQRPGLDPNAQRPAPDLLAQMQQIVQQGDPQTAVRPATLMALARSNAVQTARQESTVVDAALSDAVQTAMLKRGDTVKLAALSELSPAALSLQALPGDSAQLQLLPANAVTESPLSRSFTTLDSLRPQVGTSAWSAGLGQRLLAMAENGTESARLRLNPASLGPMEIQISVEDDRAQVSFGAQHGATREALEAALPRLREMFAEQGLQLAQADVQDPGAGAADAQEQAPDDTEGWSGVRNGDSADVAAIPQMLVSELAASGLDIYV